MRATLLMISFLLLCLSVQTYGKGAYIITQRDSMRVKVIDGKKYLLHKVEKKETWTSIAKKYSITINDLMAANKGVSVLKAGQIIQVPVSENAAAPAAIETPMQQKPQAQQAEKPATQVEIVKTTVPKYHTVKKGETLFAIAKQTKAYVNDIKKWNKISGSKIKPGQKLIVGYKETETKKTSATKPAEMNPIKAPKPEINDAATEKTTNPDVQNESNQVTKEPVKTTSTGKTVSQMTETGEAAWVNDAELNPNKFYALHRTAPIGTIVKITNKMTSKSVFVKVIGRLPNTGDNFNVIIKVSKAAADKIGAIDEKFVAEITYAAAN